jgi:hypothetical protein
MERELAARINQSVGDEYLEDVGPPSSFAARRKPLEPELRKLKILILAVLVAEVPTEEEAHAQAGCEESGRWEGGGSALPSEYRSKRTDALRIP